MKTHSGIGLDRSLSRDILYHCTITKSDVKNALRKMWIGKLAGPDDILIEVWKCVGQTGFVWLIKSFTNIL